MKKLFVFLLCASLLLSAVPSAFAAGVAPLALPTEPEIMPLWEYITGSRASLGIDGSGKATISCYGAGSSGVTTRVEIEAKLQRYWGLFWITEETFTVERDSYLANLNETYTVESGHTYRVKAKITVYSATDSESTTVTSNEVAY